MRSFQRNVWEERAWARYERQRSKDPATEPKSRLRLDVDLTSAAALERIIDWCAKKNITIEFTNRREAGVLATEEKKIYVNSTLSYEKQVFVLLHECGHLLIGFEKTHETHRFKLGYPSSQDPAWKGKFIHRCIILEEEFEAWHRGRKLAKKLEVEINENNWNATKSSFIKSYLRWAMKDPDFEESP